MFFFTFLKNWPSEPILSISQNFLMSVCVFVCVFVRQTFSLRLTVFLPPIPEVQFPNFLYFWNPWKKGSQILKLLLLKEVGAKRPLNGIWNTNTKKILLSKAKFSKNLLFLCSEFTPFISKSFQIWDNFFPLLFPKDSES